jgi:hypothetical protein
MSNSQLRGAAAAAALLAGVLAPSAVQATVFLIDPDVTLTGTVAGSATDKDGKPDKVNDDHAKEYDGATEVTVHYEITIKDGKFDPTGSKVTLTTVYFTWKGVKTPSTFATEELPITGATLGAGGEVETFDFGANDWYPGAASEGIKNNGLKGTIDLKKKTGTFTSSYIVTSDSSIYKYLVTGALTGVPEPATWALTICGFGLAGALLRRRRAAAPALSA